MFGKEKSMGIRMLIFFMKIQTEVKVFQIQFVFVELRHEYFVFDHLIEYLNQYLNEHYHIIQ